ncbi:uncharacterized protein LOC133180136 [Saccostrea echinata]|uniref:uncharacterized protein LOC133180136 n=1 Tax=Saccostrea echinata TaxID=191078 RepID=UPI002A8251FB|nr:uncharacterized protein LOC133180136 [Saccostrea echinata]
MPLCQDLRGLLLVEIERFCLGAAVLSTEVNDGKVTFINADVDADIVSTTTDVDFTCCIDLITSLIGVKIGPLRFLALSQPSTITYVLTNGGKAYHKPPTTQCSNNCAFYAADKAVDRNNDTCTRTDIIGPTAQKKEVFWYVDLGDIYNLYDIAIQFKDYGSKHEDRQRGRFAGFSLYLSNTTRKEDGHLCYKDGPQLPPLDFKTRCIGHASHVIFYNERLDGTVYPPGYESLVLTQLCEVIIRGCADRGTYGETCELNCSEHCQENRCDIINGTCLGCMAGWTGKFCQTPCESGSYGVECKHQCGGHCRDGHTCSPVTGNCDKGCASGWTGSLCNESCISGRYGSDCVFNCSGHCLNKSPCNRTNGHCDSGCSPGYTGPFCTKECTAGEFGKGCKNPCSGHCLNEVHCNHVDGTCRYGCEDGYFGQQCFNACTPGLFGRNCSTECSTNCHDTCRNTDGFCVCKSGFMGPPYCSTGCPKNRFGKNCVNSCKSDCVNNTCNRFNGSCALECMDLFFGDMCNQETSPVHPQSYSAEALTIGGLLGGLAVVSILSVLIALYRRELILKICKGKTQNSETYTNICNIRPSKDYMHNYQELTIAGDKNDYANIELKNVLTNGGKAYHKPPTTQCSNNCAFYAADKAVDRNNDTCTRTDIIGPTAQKKEVFWYVDLGDIYNLYDIAIKFKDYGSKHEDRQRGRFAGFSLYLSNTTRKEDGHLCYKDGPQLPPLDFKTRCIGHASHVIFYNERLDGTVYPTGYESLSLTELCEVTVQGCADQGTYGETCEMNCPEHCQENRCDIINGTCLGCMPGWTGKICQTPCAGGSYGLECKHQCLGHCRDGHTCNSVTGNCDKGCASGWTGSLCNESCISGRYGPDCVFNCSGHCLNKSPCNRTNGHCDSGCSPGYTGPFCTKECPHKRYGKDCVHSCSTNCVNETCNKYNGNCSLGCKDPSLQMCIQEIYSAEDHGNIKENNSSDVEKASDDTYETSKRGRPTNKTIPVKNLKVIIAKMAAAENAGFKQEYRDIPKGELHPCEEGKKPENRLRNRYTTTFPYDHSRVVLKTSSPNEGDYINANYIEDAFGNPSYIATQGPKPKTISDFWKMIWQENVSVIVCLTNLKEGEKNKCAQYWPSTNDKLIGDVHVKNLEEKCHANYTIRRFKVNKYLEKTTREVVMFHYTRWPDHGVPDPLSLVVFHRHVMRLPAQDSGTYIVVHCSAGIGRTGTFIALDALYREGERNGKVNVPMYVRTMRKDRMNMIQGDDQYKAVYFALCESFNGKSRCLTTELFLRKLQEQSCYANCGEVATKSSLTSEFQELLSLRKEYDQKDYETGRNNKSANYTDNVLPLDEYLCHLSYSKGRNTYYNAVILQSFTENDSLISAQYPLPDYAEDFLRLIKDFDVSVVVFLCPLKDLKSSSLWVPSKTDHKTVGYFTLKLTASTSSANLSTRRIDLQPKGFNDTRITVLECKTWKEGKKTVNKRALLDVVKEAKSEKINYKGKLLILSSDGATRCGAFCVVYNALEQLSMDQEVDIFTITRQLQIRRQEFVSTLDEYQLCCDAVAEYIQNDCVYANYDLSAGKNAFQGPAYVSVWPQFHAAVNAVDRNNNSCTTTRKIGSATPYRESWWMVDLGDIYSVFRIRILFKDYGEDFGFSLYLSNSSNKDEGYMCYKDGPKLPPLDFTTTCIGYGQYVIFYNERLDNYTYPEGYEYVSSTKLCEVIVHGCKLGVFGEKCDKECSKGCRDNKCNIITGACLGCKTGWIGNYCQTHWKQHSCHPARKGDITNRLPTRCSKLVRMTVQF